MNTIIPLKKIGKGGFSSCYEAEKSDKFVYKIFNKQSKEFSKELIDSEIDIFELIDNNCEYIVSYYGAKETDKRIVIKLEKCHTDLLKVRKYCKLEDEDVLNILYEMLKALEFLHSKNIVHCDIKASNVLVMFDNCGNMRLKICDFGLSQIGKSYTDCIKGTEMFLDPGLIVNSRICRKTDMWALGSLIVELLKEESNLSFLSSKSIKKGLEETQEKINAFVQTISNPFLEFAISKCLEVDHEQRISSNSLLEIMESSEQIGDIEFKDEYNNLNELTLPPRILSVEVNKLYCIVELSDEIIHIKIFNGPGEKSLECTFNKTEHIISMKNCTENEFETNYINIISPFAKKIGLKGEFSYMPKQYFNVKSLKMVDNAIEFQLRTPENAGYLEYTIKPQSNICVINTTSDLSIVVHSNEHYICAKNNRLQPHVINK